MRLCAENVFPTKQQKSKRMKIYFGKLDQFSSPQHILSGNRNDPAQRKLSAREGKKSLTSRANGAKPLMEMNLNLAPVFCPLSGFANPVVIQSSLDEGSSITGRKVWCAEFELIETYDFNKTDKILAFRAYGKFMNQVLRGPSLQIVQELTTPFDLLLT